jgi:hypothetical protein
MHTDVIESDFLAYRGFSTRMPVNQGVRRAMQLGIHTLRWGDMSEPGVYANGQVSVVAASPVHQRYVGYRCIL